MSRRAASRPGHHHRLGARGGGRPAWRSARRGSPAAPRTARGRRASAAPRPRRSGDHQRRAGRAVALRPACAIISAVTNGMSARTTTSASASAGRLPHPGLQRGAHALGVVGVDHGRQGRPVSSARTAVRLVAEHDHDRVERRPSSAAPHRPPDQRLPAQSSSSLLRAHARGRAGGQHDAGDALRLQAWTRHLPLAQVPRLAPRRTPPAARPRCSAPPARARRRPGPGPRGRRPARAGRRPARASDLLRARARAQQAQVAARPPPAAAAPTRGRARASGSSPPRRSRGSGGSAAGLVAGPQEEQPRAPAGKRSAVR